MLQIQFNFTCKIELFEQNYIGNTILFVIELKYLSLIIILSRIKTSPHKPYFSLLPNFYFGGISSGVLHG
jgi:hypothetical protein